MNATAPALSTPTERQRGAAFGLSWSAGTQVLSTALKVLSTLVLTRLLAPDAYALLGTAMIALTTLEWLSDLGIIPALVRHPQGDRREVLLVGWWLNLFRSTGMATVTFALAFPLAWIYRKPELAAVIGALALRPLLLGFRSPGVPLLRRRLDYRSLFFDEIAQNAVGAGVSILSAYLLGMQHGAWALVIGTIAGTLTGVATSYILAPIRPTCVWDRTIARQLGKFGTAVLVNTAIMAAWLNCDRLFAPALVSLTELGYYVIAWNLVSAGEALVTRCLEVYFGYLSRREPESRRAAHHKIAKYLLIGGSLVAIAVIAAAPHLVNAIYDSRYTGVGALLAVLVARLAVRTAGQFDFQLLLVEGRIRWATIGYSVGALLQLLLLFPLVSAFGALGLAYSAFLSTIAVSSVNCLGAGLGFRSAMRVLIATGAGLLGLAIAGVPFVPKAPVEIATVEPSPPTER